VKITLNTTIRPVGFDYARALCEADSLQTLVSAFPRFAARKGGGANGLPVRYCSSVQTLFIVAQRLAGANAFTRWLSHLSKVRLDGATARLLGGADAVVFYSGAGLRTIRAARRRGVLSVCQVHHTHVLEQERILRQEAVACGCPYTPIYSAAQIRMQLREFEETDVVLCPSGSVGESFERAGTPASKLLVVAHGVDLKAETASAERSPGASQPLRVLYVGQLHYRKGLRYLAAAMSEIESSVAECRVVGPDFGLSGLRGQRGDDRLTKTGPKKGASLLDEYRLADVFVLPSLEEGFGLVVLEAMRAGVPVIITSAVGAKDFVTDGVEGFVVPPGDADSLRSKLRWMQAHPAERLAMGRAAARRALDAGGWTTSAHLLVQALEQRSHTVKRKAR